MASFPQIYHGNCINSPNEVSNMIKLDDLNFDCLLEIFDKELEDLLNVADLNSRFRELILQHYIPEYHFNERIVGIFKHTFSGNEIKVIYNFNFKYDK